MKIEELLLAENKDEEESLLRKIIRKEPTNVVACIRLGNILREKGRYTEALKLHRGSLTGVRDTSLKKKLYVNIIKDYIGAGNEESAINFADELRKIVSPDIDELKFLGSIYEDLSQWKEAINSKQKFLRFTRSSDDRGLAILYAFWGDSLAKEGNKKEALKRFKEALKFDKFCLPGLLFMGDFYYGDGNADEGIKLWKRILEDIPNYAFLAFKRLADAYYTRHDFSKLEAFYTSFLNQNPEDARVLVMLSEIHEKKGEDKEAIEILERAREIEPRNIIIKKKLFKLYYDNKRYEDMFKEGEKITSLGIYRGFKCYKCNTQLEEFKFKCPQCNHWLSIR
ncbi:tetratricopeptide repeat protein [candidate division WOR-3 bacterium]|nr:tetratricopeptide repeat protein [candidate division WOR-3 bacterium]